MSYHIPQLQHISLFQNIDPLHLETMLQCLNPVKRHYPKDAVIFLANDSLTAVGIVLSGKIHITKETATGARTIIAELGANQLFGETFACAGFEKSPVTVIAAQPCQILLLPFQRIITTCSSSCTFHTKLIENMLQLIAQRNILLNQKINLMSKRTIREKIITYFACLREEQNNCQISLPFNRQELADYLCVDRSALSRELCRMRDEGLIQFQRNQFSLHWNLFESNE